MKIPNKITSFDMKKIRMISSTATYGIIQTQGFISAINPFKKHFAAKHITPANNIIHYLIYLNGKFGHIKGIPLQGLQTTKGIPLQGLQTTKGIQITRFTNNQRHTIARPTNNQRHTIRRLTNNQKHTITRLTNNQRHRLPLQGLQTTKGIPFYKAYKQPKAYHCKAY